MCHNSACTTSMSQTLAGLAEHGSRGPGRREAEQLTLTPLTKSKLFAEAKTQTLL